MNNPLQPFQPIHPGKSRRLYPVGIQDFEKLRREGYVYIDKTHRMYELASTSNPYFLSRPRRFGKSLLLSTFKAYFLGKKELFEGLYVDTVEKEWRCYPVLYLDLNAEKYEFYSELENMLESQLREWERIYGCEEETDTTYIISYSIRFMNVIKAAYHQTGMPVVVLIDEYDKPLLRSFHDVELQDRFRKLLTAFYTVLKGADPYLRFVFITGVTKFAQMGIFSTMNQLIDLSLDPAMADLCGLTKQEIETVFADDLVDLGAANDMTAQDAMDMLVQMYDGYHFSEGDVPDIFNPFSVLSAFRGKAFRAYWFSTGTPTLLVDLMKEFEYDLRNLEGTLATAEQMNDYRIDSRDPIPIIYQSGYLTIKGYNERFREYLLGYPNDEVRYGFLNFLSPYYTKAPEGRATFHINRFVDELERGDVNAFLTRFRAFFADFPYDLNDRSERHYQVVFYIVFKLMGQFIETEVRSAQGRADAVVKTANTIFVFEFKLFGSAEEALRQIDEKGYLIPYTVDGRQVVKVGVSFDAKEKNIGEWKMG